MSFSVPNFIELVFQPISEQTSFDLGCRLIGVALTLSSLEYLRITDLFSDSGLLSWKVIGQRDGHQGQSWFSGLMGRHFRIVLAARLIAGLALCIARNTDAQVLGAAVGLVASMLVSYRNVAGGDGSDQMTSVVLAGLIMAAPHWTNETRLAGLALISGQALLAYGTAGIAKAASRTWRCGQAAPFIFRTATYGNYRFGQWLADRRPLARLLCWAVIGFEVGFPIALMTGQRPIVLGALLLGVVFHVGNSALMGLNVFTWAFTATYPSLLLLSGTFPWSNNGQ